MNTQEALEFKQELSNLKELINKLEASVNRSLDLHDQQMRIDDEFFRHLDKTLLT